MSTTTLAPFGAGAIGRITRSANLALAVIAGTETPIGSALRRLT